MMKKIIKVGILLIILLVIAIFVETYVDHKSKFVNSQSFSGWSEEKQVNQPEVLEGMIPVMYEEGSKEAVIVSEDLINSKSWYDYIAQSALTENGGSSKWANVKTDDDSYWVWIPRFAYKINYTNNDDRSDGGSIEVVFLKGITNTNKDNIDVTTLGFTIHPAFQNGINNNYNNGEWDKELTGLWISKFEAGYTGIKNTNSELSSSVQSEILYEHEGINLKGSFMKNTTKIDYPIFMGQTYTYNNLEIGEMFKLAQTLTATNNPYGFNSGTTDSHMIKNSEWGAVAYLAYSQYGRNGTKITINNLAVRKNADSYVSETQTLANHTSSFIHTITGYAGEKITALKYIMDDIDALVQEYPEEAYAWYTSKGKLASTTGNSYGIYDLNGGASEYIAGYVSNANEELMQMYADSMTGNNTKYCTIYDNDYESNNKIGDAIKETSTDKGAYNSWEEEVSFYPYSESGFILRSGGFDFAKRSGIFAFDHHSGHDYLSYTFRVAIVKK